MGFAVLSHVGVFAGFLPALSRSCLKVVVKRLRHRLQDSNKS